MSRALPNSKEAQELLSLRALRVRRARQRLADAVQDVAVAELAVKRRQAAISASQSAIGVLGRAVVTSLAPHLPRWNGMVQAERARLLDRLERDDDALIGEARRLEERQEAAALARIGLARAMAREDVVRDLAQQAAAARAVAVERGIETEQADQAPAASPGAARSS
jgi:hypothetical protein